MPVYLIPAGVFYKISGTMGKDVVIQYLLGYNILI